MSLPSPSTMGNVSGEGKQRLLLYFTLCQIERYLIIICLQSFTEFYGS